ncbi:MAG TPA: hypothetical protein VGC65_08775 [Bacteroidia bacterium]|jgi:hypothetical protein
MRVKVFVYLLITLLAYSCSNKNKKRTKEEYSETAKFIWKTYVPKSGQAETVQGELLRAIEKLADEAQRNGNINFNKDCHGILISFLRQHLTDEKIFDKEIIKQVNQDLDLISVEDEPYTEEDLYDRVRYRIVDWYLHNKNPIPHPINPTLYC